MNNAIYSKSALIWWRYVGNVNGISWLWLDRTNPPKLIILLLSTSNWGWFQLYLNQIKLLMSVLRPNLSFVEYCTMLKAYPLPLKAYIDQVAGL